MWARKKAGKLPPAVNPPHIIDCLGWTEQQVEELERQDLKQEIEENKAMETALSELQLGKARIVLWKANLSALTRYDYRASEISDFEARMLALAAPEGPADS